MPQNPKYNFSCAARPMIGNSLARPRLSERPSIRSGIHEQNRPSFLRETQRVSSCTQALILVQNDLSRPKTMSVYLYSGPNSSTERSFPLKTQRASSCAQSLIPVQNDLARAKTMSVYLYSGSNSSTERSFPRKTQRASCTQALIPVQNDLSRAKAMSVYLYSGSTYSITQCDTLDCFAFRAWCSQCIADYWPRCRYSLAYCVTAVFHKSEIQNPVCEPSQAHCDLRQLQTGCFSRNLLIQSFETLFSDADASRLALATNSTTTPVVPESLEGVSPWSRGLYASSACECLRKVHISLFPRIFPPIQVLFYFYGRFLLLLW